MLVKPDGHSASAVFGTEAGALAGRFPRGFVWGVATSAYQVEGAAHEDGRGDSIWDEFCRRPGAIKDGSSGERACDHYHRVGEDVGLIASLGVNAYRFSLAWPRVQPLGAGAWNEKGFDFYDRLIDGLLERGIAPYLTLYHWDLPQALQERGGWMNRDTVSRFVDYAAEVARRFGSRAASIATHNEPWVVAILGHEAGIFAPGLKSQKVAMQVSHHLLLSHGLALQAMRAEHCTAPLGIVLNQSPMHAATDSAGGPCAGTPRRRPDDPLVHGRAAAADAIRTTCWRSWARTRRRSRPATWRPSGSRWISSASTTTRAISPAPELRWLPSSPDREVTDMGWEVFPGGLTELLLRLKADYRLPPLYITENGAAYRDRLVDGRVADADRIRYLHRHIAAMADALERGVDVRGYFVWSLLDNFEWADGYTQALRARLRRLRHAAQDTEGQRALVPGVLFQGRGGRARRAVGRRRGAAMAGREQAMEARLERRVRRWRDRPGQVGLRARQRVLRLQEPPVGARLGQRGTAVLHARAGATSRSGTVSCTSAP